MAFDDISKTTWRGIGASSSLALMILCSYDIAAAGWLSAGSTERVTRVNFDNGITVESYPEYYSAFPYLWIAAAIVLLVFNIFVFYGYATSSKPLLEKCKFGAYIAVVALLLLSVSFSTILSNRYGYAMTRLGHEIMLLSTSFMATLVAEAVLLLALVLGPEDNNNRVLVIPLPL